MKRLLLILALLFSGCTFDQGPEPPRCVPSWEYRAVVADTVDQLGELGAQGWEAVGFQAVVQDELQMMVLFKRKRRTCGKTAGSPFETLQFRRPPSDPQYLSI